MEKDCIIPIDETKEYIKIYIEWVNLQSYYKRVLFEAKTICEDNKLVSNIIGIMLETPNFEEDVYFISCFDEQLKLDILSAIRERNQKQKFISKEIDMNSFEICSGGINVFVTLEKPTKETLQNQRNKLNRQISTLKKATLKAE